MTDDRRFWLDRCVELEGELESAQRRIDDLESRLTAAISVDADGATRRVRAAEELLVVLAAHLDANPSLMDVMPPGFVQRVRAQLQAKRHISEPGPPKAGAMRATMVAPNLIGHTGVIDQRTGGPLLRPLEGVQLEGGSETP